MRAMALGGMVLRDLDDVERTQHQLRHDQLALLVKSVGQYGEHAAAKNAGFQEGDILLEMSGMKERATESEVIGKLLQKHQRGEQISAKVSRAGEQITLRLPMQ